MSGRPDVGPAAIERVLSSSSQGELVEAFGGLMEHASLEELYAALRELVRKASDEQLLAVANSDLRTQVLDEIFQRMADQFRSDAAGDFDAVVHWKVFDKPGGGYDHYELVIADGHCRLSERPSHEPKVTFRIKPVPFLKLITGNAGGTKLALTGKLQVIGDIGFARKVNALFSLPDS